MAEDLFKDTELAIQKLTDNNIKVIDLSTSLKSDFFAWEKYPNEHLNENGRKYVAKKIAEIINGYQEKSATECKKYSVDQCPIGCIVCPPCEACSSLGCNSLKFCKSIGFDEKWYETINPRLEITK